VPLIPHANTAHWDGLCPDEFWLEAGIEMLRRCDAVALVDGWFESAGTLAEIKEAERLGMPVFPPARGTALSLLNDWVRGTIDDDEARISCLALGR